LKPASNTEKRPQALDFKSRPALRGRLFNVAATPGSAVDVAACTKQRRIYPLLETNVNET
jgi:hypothetical protein